jgi:single-stranded DNA-binding protein
MSFISWVRIEGVISSVKCLQSKKTGNDYYILRIAGDDEKDCEVIVYGYGVADCRNIVEGDYAVIVGEVGIEKREGNQGGTFINAKIIGKNVRRITSIPIESAQGDVNITPKTIENAPPTEDDNDLPF